MITRKAIEERLRILQRERQLLVDNLNAYDGAIQDCQYWLEHFGDDDGLPDEAEIKGGEGA